MIVNPIIFRYLSEWIFEIPLGNIGKNNFGSSLNLPDFKILSQKWGLGNYLLVPSSMKVVWHLGENTGCFSFPCYLATHPSSHLWVYSWVQWDLPQRGQAWSLGMAWAWHACSQFSMTLCFYHLSLDKISYHGTLFVFRLISSVIHRNSRVFSFINENHQMIWN